MGCVFVNPRDPIKPIQRKIHPCKYVWIYSVILLTDILGHLSKKTRIEA